MLSIFVEFILVEADATLMGGYLSHEYHYLSPVGEAKLQHCMNCGHSSIDDRETMGENEMECSKCHAKKIDHTNGIEVNGLSDGFMRFHRIIFN